MEMTCLGVCGGENIWKTSFSEDDLQSVSLAGMYALTLSNAMMSGGGMQGARYRAVGRMANLVDLVA